MGAGRTVLRDTDQQLDVAVTARLLGGRGDRIWPFRLPCDADHHGLSGDVVEVGAVQIEAHDPGARCDREDLPETKSQEHVGLC